MIPVEIQNELTLALRDIEESIIIFKAISHIFEEIDVKIISNCLNESSNKIRFLMDNDQISYEELLYLINVILLEYTSMTDYIKIAKEQLKKKHGEKK